jgi:rubrerythrin
MRCLPLHAAWLLASLLPTVPLPVAADASPYPSTIAALQERYADEVTAHQTYGAYARQAVAEGYPSIAHLFKTLAASEAVHAENFARLLRELGQEPAVPPPPKVEAGGTRAHLRHAATVEAAEIDQEYPAILARIEPEGHEQAIRFITYAWKAEQQHRELILKIKKGASWFFGMLVDKIEGNPTRYHVCQVCGSTVTELPDSQCPICGHASAEYREVPPFAEGGEPDPAPAGQGN